MEPKRIDYRIEVDPELNTDRTLRAVVVSLGVGDRWAVIVRRCWFKHDVIQLELVTRTGVVSFAPDEAPVLARVIEAAQIVSNHLKRFPYDFVNCEPAVLLETLLPEAVATVSERTVYFYAVAFAGLGLLGSRDGDAVVHRFDDRTERDLFVALRPFHRRKADSSDPFVRRAKVLANEGSGEWGELPVRIDSATTGREFFAVSSETGFQYVHRFGTEGEREAFVQGDNRRRAVDSTDARVRSAKAAAAVSGKDDWRKMAVR